MGTNVEKRSEENDLPFAMLSYAFNSGIYPFNWLRLAVNMETLDCPAQISVYH